MSRVQDRGQSNELRKLKNAIARVGGAVTNISGGGGGDVARFDYQYDHAIDGVGEQPVLGDTLYYDPLSKKLCTERYALGSSNIGGGSLLQGGNTSRRYPLGKWDIIETSDGKKWYIGLLNSTNRSGQNVTSPAIKIYEVVDDESGVLGFEFDSFQLGSIASCPVADFSMSNIVEGSTDVFAAAFGNVDSAANTISLFKLTYSGTWTTGGGGSLQDTSMGASHANFDVRNGDLLYDAVQADFLFFGVDSTNVRVAKWQESNAASLGITTITGKTYTTDFRKKGNGFNVATKLNDGNYLIPDGTTGGNWIYSYNGSTFSSVGTNNVTSSFPNGFLGISLSESEFAFDIIARRDTSAVSYTLMSYDQSTNTLSETQKTGSHTEIEEGKGRVFDADTYAFYSPSVGGMVDTSGNIIYLDINRDIEKVVFSDGSGTTTNMSLKPIGDLLYYYSDYAEPSSNTSANYDNYYWMVSQTSIGNLQTDRLPIRLGEVTDITGTNVTVECFLENVESTSYTKGRIYSDYVALTETRAIKLNKGNSLPVVPAASAVITDTTLQAVLKSGQKAFDVFHENNSFLIRNDDKKRYVFEYNRDTNYENVQMNVLVNGIPYFSERDISVSNSWYYLDMSAEGTVFANIAVGGTARVYLFDI